MSFDSSVSSCCDRPEGERRRRVYRNSPLVRMSALAQVGRLDEARRAVITRVPALIRGWPQSEGRVACFKLEFLELAVVLERDDRALEHTLRRAQDDVGAMRPVHKVHHGEGEE